VKKKRRRLWDSGEEYRHGEDVKSSGEAQALVWGHR
jgi:hypothetical protein